MDVMRKKRMSREETIKGLEEFVRDFKPFCGNQTDWKKVYDALALLKEQDPVLLENQHKPYGHFINANSPWISRCPRCGKKVEGKQTRFCKYCGQAVKWE